MPDPNDLASQQIADTEGGYDPYKRSQPPVRVLGMTGQQDYPGAIGLPVAGGGAGNALAQRQMITAYHGSPHDFDEFDASKIGTGEGAQAYGHGLYFASNPKVAEAYRDQLSTPSVINRFYDMDGQIVRDHWSNATPEGTAAKLMDLHSNDKTAALRQIEQVISSGDKSYDWQKVKDIVTGLKGPVKRVEAPPPGHHYEVSIDAHPDEFLDWDKPLSEQSGHVVKALTQTGVIGDRSNDIESAMRRELASRTRSDDEGPALQKWYDELRAQEKKAVSEDDDALSEKLQDKMRVITDWWDKGGVGSEDRSALDPTGEELHRQLEQRLSESKNIVGSRNPPDASKALHAAGIKGIRYLDQGSRDAGHGTHNYVIFDPKIVQILKKNGIDVVRGNAAMEGE